MGLEGKTIIEWLIEKCPCGKKNLPPQRTIYINNHVPPDVDTPEVQTYASNEIISSKYTAWNFLFKNLFEQFHRIANLYFLLMTVISSIIDSPVSPWTSALPLILVIAVTMIKQGYEDILRHKSDREVNNRPALVVRDGQLQTIKAKDLKVGDIIKVTSNGGIPCDMLLLSSDDSEGTCYITTANLDGETNLKTFRCIPETKSYQTEEQLEKLTGTIICEQPNTELYKFVGNLILYKDDRNSEARPIAAENVLLRGSRLKNTGYVYGCAVFTGQDTKISMNSKFTMLKFSRVEKRMNGFLIIFLIILLAYSIIWTGLKYWYYSVDEHGSDVVWYTEGEPPATAKSVFVDFLAFMVLCNYVIPISLYVTIEIQKIIGSKFFEWDAQMFDVQTNEPAKANTSDLNEELGQVEYLFADKTGTLTENQMEFRQCSVSGQIYVELGGMLCVTTDAPQPDPLPKLTPELVDLFRVLVLCHTVHVDKKDNLATGGYSLNGLEYEYEASSPDEKALVEACRRYGIVFHGMKDGYLEVTFFGSMRRYQLHHVLEFDANRKCMSVIVQDEDGSVYLMTKGAESAIFSKTIAGDVDIATKHLEQFAKLGLRTLCIAQKKLTEEEFLTFDSLLKSAQTALYDREDKVAMSYDAIERNLTLLGVTAVEDKLQDGVKETITALRQAGIKVWVVTGDKEETAVNISYSAGHFHPDMVQLSLTRQTDTEQCQKTIDTLQKQLTDNTSLRQYCLVVDGPSLRLALHVDKDGLLSICQNVVTVLACRMTPLQKADVVSLIKTSKGNPCTAAIGDGANDVSMILEAHLGLAIMGKEGRQAVRASDYAFGRFRFLQRALLVHGHYYYVRLATLVQYFFYKNVAMILAQLYYTFFSAFSIQSVYDGLFLTFYNITMTALPVLLYGLCEQNCKQEILLEKPELYRTIQKNKKLTYLEFFKWNAIGVWHSIVFFFGVYFALYQGNSPDESGQQYGVYEFGALVMICCVFTVNIKLMLVSYYYNVIIWMGYLITVLGFFGLVFLISEIWWPFIFENTFFGSFAMILSSPFSWLLMLVLIVAALLIDIVLRAVNDTFSPLYRSRATMNKVGDWSALDTSTLASHTEGYVNQTCPDLYKESSNKTSDSKSEFCTEHNENALSKCKSYSDCDPEVDSKEPVSGGIQNYGYIPDIESQSSHSDPDEQTTETKFKNNNSKFDHEHPSKDVAESHDSELSSTDHSIAVGSLSDPDNGSIQNGRSRSNSGCQNHEYELTPVRTPTKFTDRLADVEIEGEYVIHL